MERYAGCTFFASVPSQQEADDTDAVIKETVKFLVENEFVRLQKCDENTERANKALEVSYIEMPCAPVFCSYSPLLAPPMSCIRFVLRLAQLIVWVGCDLPHILTSCIDWKPIKIVISGAT